MKATFQMSWSMIKYYALIVWLENLKKVDIGIIGEDGTVGYYVGQTRYRAFVGRDHSGMRGPRQIMRATAYVEGLEEPQDVTQYLRELAGPAESFPHRVSPAELGWKSLKIDLQKGETKTFEGVEVIQLRS